jgi:hypothetical protein
LPGFWQHYDDLSLKLDGSPPEAVSFGELIEAVRELEAGAYRQFCAQIDIILDKNGSSVDVQAHTKLFKRLGEWKKRHNAMLDAYETIKQDTRFQRLWRPVKPSRWGSRAS